jgi:hypothetical protein
MEELKKALESSWTRQTCYGPFRHVWNNQCKAVGQCYSTALIVQDILGGELVKGKDSQGRSHYWNKVDGVVIDFTRDQYPDDEIFSELRLVQRKDCPHDERYVFLKEKVMRHLNN